MNNGEHSGTRGVKVTRKVTMGVKTWSDNTFKHRNAPTFIQSVPASHRINKQNCIVYLTQERIQRRLLFNWTILWFARDNVPLKTMNSQFWHWAGTAVAPRWLKEVRYRRDIFEVFFLLFFFPTFSSSSSSSLENKTAKYQHKNHRVLHISNGTILHNSIWLNRKAVKCQLSLWPSEIGVHLGRNRLWVRFLAVSDIYPMFIQPTITWVPSGFSGYISYYGLTQKLC